MQDEIPLGDPQEAGWAEPEGNGPQAEPSTDETPFMDKEADREGWPSPVVMADAKGAHREAAVIVYGDLVTPDGVGVNFTMREGATPEAALEAIYNYINCVRYLADKHGFTPVLGNWAYDTWKGIGRNNGQPARPQGAPAPAATSQAPPPAGAPAAPGAPTTPAVQQGVGGELKLQIAKVKVVPRTNDTEVQLFGVGHKWPDLRTWGTPEELVERFAVVAGFQANDFQRAQEFNLTCDAVYTLSEKVSSKGNPYKDLVRVQPIAQN